MFGINPLPACTKRCRNDIWKRLIKFTTQKRMIYHLLPSEKTLQKRKSNYSTSTILQIFYVCSDGKICYFVKVGNNSIILPWTCISYYFLNDFYEVRLKNAVATHFKNIHTVHNIKIKYWTRSDNVKICWSNI